MADTDDLIFSVSADTTAIKRALNKLVGDIDTASGQISRKFDKVGLSLDNSVTTALQARVNAMVGIGVQGANEWSGALADQGKQLDSLRQKYNPLLATIRQYQSAASNIKTLYASGTIGVDEYTAAMSRQRQAALASIAAIKSQGVAAEEAAVAGTALHGAAGLGATQMMALTHAARSVAEQLALGVPLSQALTGQFGHLSYVASGPGGVTGALKAVGSGIISLAEAFPGVTLSIGAAAAASALYYAATHASSERSAEDLDKQIDLIRGVAESWGAATPALSRYIDELDRAKEVADTLAAGKAAGDLGFDDVRKTASDISAQRAAVVSDIAEAGDTDAVDKINNAWQRVSEALEKGRTDTLAIKDMQEALAQALTDTAIPSITDFAKAFATLAAAMEKANTQAQIFNAEAIAAIAGGSNVQDIVSGNTFTDQNGKTHQTSTFLPDQGPVPEKRPNIELEGLPGDDARQKKAEAAAAELKKRQDELFRTSSDRIEQMRVEIGLIGQSGVAADKARFATEQWQKAEKLSLGPDQQAALQDKIDAYGRLADMMAKMKVTSDLADKNRLAGLSTRDQQIVEVQKQYGLPENPDSAEGRQIGASIDRQELAGGIKTFFTDLEGGLTTKGKKIGEVLGDAVKNAAQTAMQKALDSLFGQVSNGLASLLTGDKTGTAAKILGNSSGVIGTAPVIPVTRAPLGDIGSYAKAIQSIESGGDYGALGPVTKTGDRAYGAYQVMGANIPSWTKAATGTALDPQGFLADRDAQDAVFKKYFGESLSKYGNPDDAASVWFSGRPLAAAGNANDGFNTTSQYVDKFRASLGDATKGLGAFEGGLGQLGQSLAGAGSGSAVGQYGGLWGSIGKLFGGISPTSSLWAPNTTFGAFLGLADGGHVTGPGSPTSDSIPTMLSNGEYVINAASTKKHRALIEAINTGKVKHFADGGLVSPTLVSAPVAPVLVGKTAQGSNRGEPGVLHVNINGANGDEHVRMLVKQGVNSGLSQYNDQQRRGGFGTMQNRWTSQKG